MFQGVTKIQLQTINIKKFPQFSPMVLKIKKTTTKKNIWYISYPIPMTYRLHLVSLFQQSKLKSSFVLSKTTKKKKTEIDIWNQKKGDQMNFSCHLSTIPDKTA